ncbi:MAG: hypothetical protein EOO50_07015 [Flavobacterium sp.]|uniref:DUF6929 family protein n=1 Tax=Flavobacterium sp. TaxID=239 RepID=UPI0011FD3F9D|nr:hypothetical protein [Flavobacterium sp.]RZJ67006.1 MAG: hypothetical protein EOO50_07015 [Flavobacterium sp.]
MKRFSLEVLYHIVGIGSASGIFFKPGIVFIVSDNGGYLYSYEAKTERIEKTALIEGNVLENMPKSIKPDFEAMAEDDGKLYIFGSGSTGARNRMVEVDCETKKVGATTDLTNLYEQMKRESSISDDNFNLEGAICSKDVWYFFQRGNGGEGKNGVFTVNGKLDHPKSVTFSEVILPEIKGVTVSFTDAVLVGKDVWFLGSAEDTKSTYDDGEVVGSVVGKMDLKTMTVSYSEQISDTHKFEGIAYHSDSKETIRFLLCEDNDSNYLESDVFLLEVED